MAVPKRVRDRFESGLKRLRPILEQQRARDVAEADTVTLVKDVLSDVLGYDKYTELTGEYQIRGTYVDLAVRIGEKIVSLIEVKAIGLELKDRHLKQALGYAANKGVEWVVLTNGVVWRLYNVIFAKPIDRRLVADIDILKLDLGDDREVERLYALSKEGVQRGAHVALKDRQEALSRHLLAALMLQNRKLLTALRREVRRIVNIRVETREIRQVLRQEVIKRDILEDPAYTDALSRVRPAHMERIEGGATGGERSRPRKGWKSIGLHDLIENGAVQSPLVLYRKYKGTRYEVVLRPDGLIEWEGRTYESPSKVASEVRERVVGRPMGTNGWTFWRYDLHTGEARTLADARDSVLEARPCGAEAPSGKGEAG